LSRPDKKSEDSAQTAEDIEEPEIITDIEELQKRYDLWCGKSRVAGSLEWGSLPTLYAV
jgi:hypothetical protein